MIRVLYPEGHAPLRPGAPLPGAARGKGSRRGRANRSDDSKGDPVPSYYVVPVSLVLMSVALVAIIYWGGFQEERRNGRVIR
jgi:hypothetical protein